MRAQIERFKRWADLIGSGAYFRLVPPDGESDFTAWQFASEDRREALLSLVVTHPRANPRSAHVCLRGLDPNACYRVDELVFAARSDVADARHEGGTAALTRGNFSGSFLMHAGVALPHLFGDYPAVQLHFVQVEGEKA